MAGGFKKVRFNVFDKDIEELKKAGTRPTSLRGAAQPAEAAAAFNNDEAAARYFLSQVLGLDKRPAVRGLSAADQAEQVPDMRLVGVQDLPLTKTRLVSFEQTEKTIPIFGSRAIVELDQNRELMNVAAEVTEETGVSPVAALSPADALNKIADLTGVAAGSLAGVQPPQLTFFHDDKKKHWHLAYFCRRVPAAPPGFVERALKRKSHAHGIGRSPRERHPQLDYLVDAHDGTVLFYYSAMPLIAIPSKCKGVDERDNPCEFWGRKMDGSGFELNDPIRFIKTYNHQLHDILNDPAPTQPISSVSSDWGATNRAAVSAHVNATAVYNFYKSVLMRDGIDDKGMDLVSVVNCTYAEDEQPPQWHNAVWYENRMWYGQVPDASGVLHSYSQYLDVIAHELTHGVTDNTSQLVYKDQSGALNESFSDIFGVIINNWTVIGADSGVAGWNWEMGPGLGGNGLPLRDMSDPTRTGDPDHMQNFLRTTRDSGGVHTNSNIHNKAAYYVLTAQDATGQRVFTAREVAVLYYLCLCRLNRLAGFSDALESLVEVATVYWAGDAQERQAKVKQIQDAYGQVGITL